MARKPANFTKADVARLVRGVIAAGLPVAGVRIDGEGVTVLTSDSAASVGAGEGVALDAAKEARRMLEASNG